MKNKIKNNLRRGQVAIIVMLVSALLITLGLSLSKKTTVETKIDYNEEALKKAFNAAESGIDYYLATGTTAYRSDDNLSEANVAIENIGGGDQLDFDEFTAENGVQYFWLVGHETNGSLVGYYNGNFQICADSFNGSMEISQFYLNEGVYGVKRYGYDFDRATYHINDFQDNSASDCTNLIASEGNTILVTVTPIFTGTEIYMTGTENFPVQGEKINSTGSAGVIFGETNESSKINKKLVRERRYKFPYFLLSGIVSETSVLSR